MIGHWIYAPFELKIVGSNSSMYHKLGGENILKKLAQMRVVSQPECVDMIQLIWFPSRRLRRLQTFHCNYQTKSYGTYGNRKAKAAPPLCAKCGAHTDAKVIGVPLC